MIISDAGSAALDMVEGFNLEGGFVILLWELMEMQENIFPHRISAVNTRPTTRTFKESSRRPEALTDSLNCFRTCLN